MTTKSLHFKWTISRGRDTYGYNICTLLVDGDKVAKCNGGGYDMPGTVFAQWLESAYQTDLVKLLNENRRNEAFPNRSYGNTNVYDSPLFYGISLHVNKDGERAVLDGGCGMESMKRIAEALGIKLQWNKESDRYKNHTFYTAIIN